MVNPWSSQSVKNLTPRPIKIAQNRFYDILKSFSGNLTILKGWGASWMVRELQCQIFDPLKFPYYQQFAISALKKLLKSFLLHFEKFWSNFDDFKRLEATHGLGHWVFDPLKTPQCQQLAAQSLEVVQNCPKLIKTRFNDILINFVEIWQFSWS